MLSSQVPFGRDELDVVQVLDFADDDGQIVEQLAEVFEKTK
jgi:hypothetical protein